MTLGYFAQEHEQVDLGVTVLENIDDTVLVNETERRALLGSFGIAGKAAHQMPKTLSGGERAKLGLAMLAAGRANLLLLDEPTNNLDPSSIEAVGTMLSRWPGTIVVVSHDRAFVEALEPTHCPEPARRGLHPLGRRLPRPGGDEVGDSPSGQKCRQGSIIFFCYPSGHHQALTPVLKDSGPSPRPSGWS